MATPSTETTAEVLVVDDDRLLGELLVEWVQEKWHCTLATSGTEALETVDETTDVVLLDRQMPEMTGEEVLTEIRDRDLDIQVMMVSGVEPDIGLIDVPIDDYLQKPVSRHTLQETIEQLLVRRTYEPTVEQFYACEAKLDALETALPAAELAMSERYRALEEQADALRRTADASFGQRTDRDAGLSETNID